MHQDQEDAGIKKTFYFLVSVDWIERWKNWTDDDNAEYPGPIDNTALL